MTHFEHCFTVRHDRCFRSGNLKKKNNKKFVLRQNYYTPMETFPFLQYSIVICVCGLRIRFLDIFFQYKNFNLFYVRHRAFSEHADPHYYS